MALKEAGDLMTKILNSGNPTLDADDALKLTALCRSNEDVLRYVHRSIMKGIERQHAQVRISAIQLVNHFFVKSKVFRELTMPELQHIIDHAVGGSGSGPLPPPAKYAKRLYQMSLDYFYEWYTKFSDQYKQLALAYNHLKKTHKVDFNAIEHRALAERQRDEQRQKRREAVIASQYSQAHAQMKEHKADIAAALEEINSCLQILLCPYEEAESMNTSGESAHPEPAITAPMSITSTGKGSERTRTRTKHRKTKPANESRRITTKTPALHSSAKNHSSSASDDDDDGEFHSPTSTDNEDESSGLSRQLSSSTTAAAATRSQSQSQLLPDSQGQLDEASENVPISKNGTTAEAAEAASVVAAAVATKEADPAGATEATKPTVDEGSGDVQRSESLLGDIDPAQYEEQYMQEQQMQQHARLHELGLPSAGYAIDVSVASNPLGQAAFIAQDKPEVAQLLKQNTKLITTKYEPMLRDWLKVLQKSDNEESKRLLPEIISFRMQIDEALKKAEPFVSALGTDSNQSALSANDNDDDGDDDDDDDADDDDDDEMVDVPFLNRDPSAYVQAPSSVTTQPSRKTKAKKKGSTTAMAGSSTATTKPSPLGSGAATLSATAATTQPRSTTATTTTTPSKSAVSLASTTSASSASAKTAKPDTVDSTHTATMSQKEPDIEQAKQDAPQEDLRSRLLRTAPVVEWGPDLEYWGKDLTKEIVYTTRGGDHRFWGASADEDRPVTAAQLGYGTRPMVLKFQQAEVKWACRAPLGDGRTCPRKDLVRCPFHGRIIARDENGVAANPDEEARVKQEVEQEKQEYAPKPVKRRYPGLVDIKKETSFEKIKRLTRNAPLHSIDPVTDKLRKDKFSGNWVDPND